jgi:outer membrane autotransporter protein
MGIAAGLVEARAQGCPIDGSNQASNSAAGTSCSIAPGSTVARATASNTAGIVANGVRINVPFNVAATAASGGIITLGIDPTAGGSTIAGGGGTTGLDAIGLGSRIVATGLTINLTGGGTTSAKAEAGGQITLNAGTTIQMVSGGTQGLWATGAGSQIVASGITVTGNTGGGDLPVHSQSGAMISVTDSTVALGGNSGGKIDLFAEGGSTLTASNVAITLVGSGGDAAASAASGSTITLTGGFIILNGSGGGETGLLVQSSGSSLTASNVPIVVTGTGGDTGVKVASGGSAVLTGGSVAAISSAGGERGIWATGSGSTISMSGVQVSVPLSTGGNGILADTGAMIALGAGTSVSTGGTGTTGIQASGTSSTVSATGSVAVTTAGAGATGVGASSGGAVSLSGGSVTTSGGGATGFNASGGTINAVDVVTSTTGVAAHGGTLQNGGTLSVVGGGVTTSGAGSFGFLVQGVGGTANTLQINNAMVNSAADAFHVNQAMANIAVAGSTVIGNNGVLLSTQGSGSTTFTATASQLTGAATTGTGSTANMTLQDDTTWTMTGSSNVTNLVNDPSTIIFTPPSGDPTVLASYKTLTAGNYTGLGGRIVLNTYLGSDGSPSDRLVINGGTASGTTLLEFHNTTGPGSETVGDGILVVNAINGATTVPGAFTRSNEVRGGAFDYDLFRGGITGGSPNNWFLRSEFTVGPLPPDGGGGGLPEQGGNFPTDPPPDPLPPGVYPIIGPALATYGVVQPIARQMGFAMLGTLHERIGDTLTQESAGTDAEGLGRSGWARIFGQQIDNRYRAFADPSAEGRLIGVQAGFDIWRGSFIPGHRDAAGFYFAYGNSAMDVNGLVTNPSATAYVRGRTGTLNLYGYSGGAYWTHYGPGGWYIDAVVQGTAYTGTATTQFANLPTNGSGIITSLEVGYPIPLPLGPRFELEPQGQILWQHTSFSQANDGLGEVALGTTSGATGRLGVRGQWTITSDGGLVWQPYVRANLWQNWGGNATTTFSGIDHVPLQQESTQLEFAAGVTARLSALVSLYAQAGYEFAVGSTDGGRRQGVKGDFGLRLTFGQPPSPQASAAVPSAAVARSYLVFFDWDTATLTDRAKQIIREAADNSTHVQYTRIAVNGYTDTSGTARYNKGLSLRRAEAVASELVRDGVPRDGIAIQGFGDTHLLVPTGPGVREPQNRRVEIIVR